MTGTALLWELTARCDRSCSHCYNVWRHEPSYGTDELSWPELQSLAVRALQRFSPSSVTVIGGEPLLHDRLFDLLGRLSQLGVRSALSTHGGHLGRTEARHLVRAGVSAVEVSIGSDPGDGSTVAASGRALQTLEQAGLAPTASLVLARPFRDVAMDWVARAVSFGAAAVVLQPLVEPFAGCLSSSLALQPGEQGALLGRLGEWATRTGFPIVMSGLVPARRVPSFAAGLVSANCRCGESKVCLDPSGRVRRCEVDPEILGDDRGRTASVGVARPHRSLQRAPREPRCLTCASAMDCEGDCARLVRSSWVRACDCAHGLPTGRASNGAGLPPPR